MFSKRDRVVKACLLIKMSMETLKKTKLVELTERKNKIQKESSVNSLIVVHLLCCLYKKNCQFVCNNLFSKLDSSQLTDFFTAYSDFSQHQTYSFITIIDNY